MIPDAVRSAKAKKFMKSRSERLSAWRTIASEIPLKSRSKWLFFSRIDPEEKVT
jgi:hypothetical protein